MKKCLLLMLVRLLAGFAETYNRYYGFEGNSSRTTNVMIQ